MLKDTFQNPVPIKDSDSYAMRPRKLIFERGFGLVPGKLTCDEVDQVITAPCGGNSVHEADILTFFDADDEMHPQRLEFIRHAFTLHTSCEVLYHSFINHKYERSVEQFGRLDVEMAPLYTNILIVNPNGIGLRVWPNKGYDNTVVVHGHPTVRTSLFTRFKFPPNSVGMEDAVYAATLVREGIHTMWTPLRLSRYL